MTDIDTNFVDKLVKDNPDKGKGMADAIELPIMPDVTFAVPIESYVDYNDDYLYLTFSGIYFKVKNRE